MPDSAFSLKPEEVKQMVEAVRTAEKALGMVRYEVTEREQASRVFRRSHFAVKKMKAMDKFTPENVRSIRPGNGLSPKYLNIVLGKKAGRELQKGTPLSWDLLS